MTLRLELFGALRLVRESGAVVPVPRRRAALLALLVEAGDRGLARDKLLAYLWPDSATDQARHSLDQALYELRREGGQGVFVGTSPLRLNADLVASDYDLFNRAIDRGGFEAGIEQYRGPFLDGFFLSDAPEFERWAESTRARMRDRYGFALEQLATQASSAGDHHAAAKWWRAFASHDPMRSRGAIGLMNALLASGDRAAALQHARTYETLVRAELDSEPDAAVSALATRIREMRDERTTHLAEVSQGTTEAVTAPRISRASQRHLGVWAAAAVVLLAVMLALSTRPFSRSNAGRDPRGIAVMPFLNMSGTPNDEYLSDGLTEELTSAIAKLNGLHVIGRTSTFALKDAHLDTRQLGDTLHVATVVEGGLRRSANRIRLTVRLLDAATGYQVWARTYEGSEAEVWSMEDAAVREIAQALHVQPTGTSTAISGRLSTASLPARDAYLKGRFLWQRRSAGSLRRALAFYGEATAHDPTFARAYAGIADAYTSLGVGNLTDNPPDVYFDSARTAAERAIALDSSLAEAHASLGQIQILYALDWDGGTRSLARAEAIDSTYASIYEFRTELYEWRGQGDSAVAESERGLRLDPLGLNANVESGRALFFAHRYDEAITRLRRTQDLDSNFARVYMVLGEVYSMMGRHADAARELRRAIALTSGASRALSLLGAAYAVAGDDAKALEIIAELTRRAKTRYVPALDFAIVEVGRDNRDEAFRWLNKAYDDHSLRPYIAGPEFDRLRGDARYGAFLAKLRLRGAR